ncbi:MAG: acetylglutamate kinase [Corynebacteriales bacterium]|nr:acetylglutamate kinase [Mycobacteriales bacterium]
MKTTPLTAARDKAATLVEALPWIRRFRGATVVVKFGGSAMTDPALAESFAADVVFLHSVGVHPVIVHGGGPHISAMLDKLGVTTEFRGGLRVTTEEAIDVVRMVLVGQVGRDLIGVINQYGPLAVGMSGEDAQLFTAARRSAIVDGEPVDVGLVGDITRVNTSLVTETLAAGRIPVIASCAPDIDGQLHNVNADTAAAALATALNAHKLVLLTDVDGLYSDWPDPNSRIAQLTVSELESLLPTLEGGMVPKMQACFTAVDGGVRQAHVVDGRAPHSVLLEIFTDMGVGTMVVPS